MTKSKKHSPKTENITTQKRRNKQDADLNGYISILLQNHHQTS